MSHDLRNTSDEAFALLTNDEIIAIDQDPLGIAGYMFYRDDDYEIWSRPLFNGDYAVAVFNKKSSPLTINLNLRDAHIAYQGKACLRDLDLHQDVGCIKINEALPINDSIFLLFLVASHLTKIYRVTLQD